MAFVFTCAGASSQTSRGASEHSAAQSRKLERNPCGTTPTPRSRTIFEIATSESGVQAPGAAFPSRSAAFDQSHVRSVAPLPLSAAAFVSHGACVRLSPSPHQTTLSRDPGPYLGGRRGNLDAQRLDRARPRWVSRRTPTSSDIGRSRRQESPALAVRVSSGTLRGNRSVVPVWSGRRRYVRPAQADVPALGGRPAPQYSAGCHSPASENATPPPRSIPGA